MYNTIALFCTPNTYYYVMVSSTENTSLYFPRYLRVSIKWEQRFEAISHRHPLR